MSTNQIQTACVMMTGGDSKMDQVNYNPVNKLPVKCAHCTFPDLDFVPEPYLLVKGFASPAETTSAHLGNFLVRDHVRRILEIAVPDQCRFHPTAEFKSKKPTDWWLAAPVNKLNAIKFQEKWPISCCSKCGEGSGGYADDWNAMNAFDSGGIDIFKSKQCEGTNEQYTLLLHNQYNQEHGRKLETWADRGLEAPPHDEYWIRNPGRKLYFSVRLEQLFRRAKVRGQLVRYLEFKDVKTSPADEAWIAEKLKLLAAHGLVDAPKSAASKLTNAAKKWFQQFVKKNAAKKSQRHDFAAVEKKQQLALPADYKDFITVVGPKTFADVNGMEGATTSVLPPAELDCKIYRRGKVPDLEGEDAEVDGVAFATVDSGDVFVFDVAAPGGDWPVYFYNHEENSLEQFAANFAECIRRFAKKD